MEDDEYSKAWRDGEQEQGDAAASEASTPLVDAVKAASVAAEGSTADETVPDEDEYVREHRRLEKK